MPDAEELYWDSCVFLSFINNGPEERIENIEPLMDRADGKALRIITSTLSIAEVAYAAAERDDNILDPEIEAKIDAMWQGHPGISFVEMYAGIGYAARDLIRRAVSEGIKRPSGADAVHLASAFAQGVKVFHTYDDKLLPLQPLVPFKIEHPLAEQPYLSAEQEGDRDGSSEAGA